MDWVNETLGRVQGIEELRSVSEQLLRLPADQREQTLDRLWRFTYTLEGDEQLKFTVMATVLAGADTVLREKGL